MRRAVRAIILRDDKLLVMHRNKFGKEYDTLPGGNIELGETPEIALTREVNEETGVVFQTPRLVFIEHVGDPYGTQYVYLCEYVSGEPHLDPNSEEAAINKLGKNLYQPAWIIASELEHMEFITPRLKNALVESFKSGFPPAAIVL